MATDIGALLFVELLGMTQYPGAPFTGNIYRDLIMFLIVPTIFIIMVLYVMTGRIIPDQKLRIMLGVGAYLFIIAGGYYSAFALLSGPYFIFLIFILGLLGYLARHFHISEPGGGPYSGGGYSDNHHKTGHTGKAGKLDMKRRHLMNEEIKDLRKEIVESQKRKKDAINKGLDRAVQAENDRIAEAERKIRDLQNELKFFR